ncbi:myelin-associated neurite-outgrowth inhibitor-like [Choloepus didactylus]|uniref:myelin-associated neurite-outgrowth inhibitor-like n=1 Tax=Choloepus didactylus TaxID=27675 RepID=UPI0018A071F4|nr:myelin-associated neurite-outgrowth inhibitor-like [Choloepus didactylus]
MGGRVPSPSPRAPGRPPASARWSPRPRLLPRAACFPMGYAAALACSPHMYQGANPAFQTCYTPGTPYKVSCSPTSGAVPPYFFSPSPYQTAGYRVRKAHSQQSPCVQRGPSHTQPLYAAPPRVVHRTAVVQPKGTPASVDPAPIPPPRGKGVTKGTVVGTTMATSAGTLPTTHSLTPVAPHPVTLPMYWSPGTVTYSYAIPQ